MSADMYDALLSALQGIPRLPGAECRNHPPELFDERRPDEPDDDWTHRSQTALRLCRTCPALTGCKTWFTALPANQRPPGVIAGQINQHDPARRPTTKATAS